jgi:hypothetical protein
VARNLTGPHQACIGITVDHLSFRSSTALFEVGGIRERKQIELGPFLPTSSQGQ